MFFSKTDLFKKSIVVVLLLLTVLLCMQMLASLRWELDHDAALLHYSAMLMTEFDQVPYRDFLDTAMPMSFLFHAAIGQVVGYSDFAYRCFDIAFLCLFLAVTFLFVSRFGKICAWGASVLFGLFYLAQGQTVSLQRDYFGTFPIACALLMMPVKPTEKLRLTRFFVLGFLFSVSSWVKPHLIMGSVPIFFCYFALFFPREKRSFGTFFYSLVITGLGFAVPVAGMFLWLYTTGALPSFIGMMSYLPLYSHMSQSFVMLYGAEYYTYLIETFLELGKAHYLIISMVCSVLFFFSQKKEIGIPSNAVAIALCAVMYFIYPLPAGKFWLYHYIPFFYFGILTASLCLATLDHHEQTT